jgi:hypothetical protein
LHLDACKKVILDVVAHHKPRTVSILGSGWLLDVPLVELSASCQHVYLYDIVHPNIVRHKISKLENVTCVESDITGGLIEMVYNSIRNPSFDLSTLVVPTFEVVHETDLVVSLNILNQLDILICDYIMSRVDVSEPALRDFRKRIQQSHVDFLAGNDYCLISDIEEVNCNLVSGEHVGLPLVLVHLPETGNRRTWQWFFDSSGMYHDGMATMFNVVATWNS